VVVDIPKDVSAAQTHYSRLERINFPCVVPNSLPSPPDLQRAAEAILKARQPVLYVGGGIVNSGASAPLLAFAQQLQLPVTPTLMGLGGFPSAHPLSLGMLGMHGTFAANMAVAESDLLIAIGVRFDDRVTGKLATFAPRAKVIHIDIDPANVGKNRAPDLSLIADARATINALHHEVESKGTDTIAQSIRQRTAWWDRLRSWQREQPIQFSGSRDQIKPQHVIRELHRLTNGEAIIGHRRGPASDVGGAILSIQP
jgi:acetolactate synthase-1/2/3 large subunit